MSSQQNNAILSAEQTEVIPVISDKDQSSRGEQLRKLYLDQKHTLDIFLQNGAITRAQYDKSLGDLTWKMGMERDEEDPA